MKEIYTTKQGETWDLIAYKIWGDEYLCGELIDSNPNYSEYLIFPRGINLIVPDIEREVQETLPPWR